MWPFRKSKPTLNDVVQAELERREREQLMAARTTALQQSLRDAVEQLGPHHRRAATND